MTAKPLKVGATYDDLRRVPEHFVAEMLDGELLALEAGNLKQLAEHHGTASIRARPFDAIELELRALSV